MDENWKYCLSPKVGILLCSDARSAAPSILGINSTLPTYEHQDTIGIASWKLLPCQWVG